MLKKCMDSWKEYGELTKMGFQWVRRHWKGYALFVIVVSGIQYILFMKRFNQTTKRLESNISM